MLVHEKWNGLMSQKKGPMFINDVEKVEKGVRAFGGTLS